MDSNIFLSNSPKPFCWYSTGSTLVEAFCGSVYKFPSLRFAKIDLLISVFDTPPYLTSKIWLSMHSFFLYNFIEHVLFHCNYARAIWKVICQSAGSWFGSNASKLVWFCPLGTQDSLTPLMIWFYEPSDPPQNCPHSFQSSHFSMVHPFQEIQRNLNFFGANI